LVIYYLLYLNNLHLTSYIFTVIIYKIINLIVFLLFFTSLFSSMISHKIKKWAFTLLELIVVIAILSILGTIAFLSLNWYSSSARDSARLSDIKSLTKWIEVYQSKTENYPLPDSLSGTGIVNGVTVSYLGTIQNRIISMIGISKSPVDPSVNTIHYPYGVTWDQQSYQIAATLESGNSVSYIASPFVDTVYASSSNIAQVQGNYSWLIKYSTGWISYVANIPSLIYSFSGNTATGDLLNSINTIYVTDKNTNLPYLIDGVIPTGIKNGNQILQELTGTSSVTLTGVIVPSTISDFNTNSTVLSQELWYQVP